MCGCGFPCEDAYHRVWECANTQHIRDLDRILTVVRRAAVTDSMLRSVLHRLSDMDILQASLGAAPQNGVRPHSEPADKLIEVAGPVWAEGFSSDILLRPSKQ